MMKTGELNTLLLIWTILVAAALIILFQLIYRIIIPSVPNRKFKQFMLTWAFRSQVFSWSVYFMFFFYEYFISTPIFTLFSVLLTLVLGWQFWRDLISGLVFKIENKVSVGDTIQYNDQTGKVLHIGNRNLILESNNKEQIVIYHRMIIQKGYKIMREKDLDNAIEFFIDKETIEHFGGIEEIHKLIEVSPWASPLHKPEIKESETDQYSIKIWALNPADKEKYKNSILYELGNIN